MKNQYVKTKQNNQIGHIRLQPEGVAPLRCDKTACWSYEDRVYLFGGFGPPPMGELGMQGNLYHFVEDPSTMIPYGGYIRGWSNQLVVYNRITNRLGCNKI